MILDYEYDQRMKRFTISYINQKGTKSFYEFNINRWKTYYPTPTGEYRDWDGTKVGLKYTDKPSKFDIMEFVEDLDPKIKAELFDERCVPKLYTWDIETEFDPEEKPDPQSAKFPVTAISCVSPEMKVMVLGTKDLSQEVINSIDKNIKGYCAGVRLCQELKLVPEFIYKKFDNEHDMLQWFVKNIIAKVPVLAGWNSDGFDQQYITNRIKNYYDDISLYSMSCRGRMGTKKIVNMFRPTDDVRIPSPKHTLMVDMMDVIKTHDMAILPIKESMSLDWISEQSLGVKKIKYDGNLNTLYDDDPERFFYYNAIDSVLVQLIHKRFRTLNLIFNYANVTHLPIEKCFGKIAPAEALFFQNFHSKGMHIVYYPDRHVERGELPGAYVKEPYPGQYSWCCCFDFASLYPTQVMTCNLSVENFINPPRPEGWTPEELDGFKKDENYFVSVNGNVYKNDQDYAFRQIQIFLKENRNKTKYLAKEMDAQVMSIIDRVMKTGKNDDWVPFTDDVREWMEKNYNISDKKGVAMYGDLDDLKFRVQSDIDNMISREQSFKLLGNSCYGGSSHQSFYWYNMGLAADITGESRALIHMMEAKTQWVFDHWGEMDDLRKKLGVTLNPEKLDNVTHCISTVYQDTDSSYVNLGPIVDSIVELEGADDKEKCKFCVQFADVFMNDYFFKVLDDYFTPRHVKNRHFFELETVSKRGIWMNIKKRYAQALMWKDGRFYDEPKMKVKGLEVIKGSYPSFSRKILKDLVMMLLTEDIHKPSFIHELNLKAMQWKDEFMRQDPDYITEAISISDYWKGIDSDDDPSGLRTAKGASFNVKALGLYNWMINAKKLPGENVYGGKVRCYLIKKNHPKSEDVYFAYPTGQFPSWAPPIDKDGMYTKTVLDPVNRIITAIGLPELKIDGAIQVDLFGGMW